MSDVKVVVVGNEKGGVGKTTTAANLAVACALAGHDVAIVDCDGQRSISGWLDDRKEAGVEPYIPGFQLKGRCGKEIVAMKQKYQTLIVDVAGHDSVELREAIIVANIWLVPTSVDRYDTDALPTAMQIVRMTELGTGIKPNARLLINKCSTSIFEQDANKLIQAIGTEAGADIMDTMPPLTSRLSNRKAYPRSSEFGMGVIEHAQRDGATNSDRAAAQEIIALYEEVFGVPFQIKEA